MASHRRVHRLAASCLLVVMLVGCTPSSDKLPRPDRTAPDRTGPPGRAPVTYSHDTVVGLVGSAVVVALAGTFEADCLPLDAAGVLVRFVAGIAENPRQALALVHERFAWYSMSESGPPRRHVVVHQRESLAELLDTRAAQHERQRVTAVKLRPDGNFELLGARVADDLPEAGDGPVRATSGKGKVNCSHGSVEALSLVVEGAPGRRGEFEKQHERNVAPPEQLRAAVARVIAELARPLALDPDQPGRSLSQVRTQRPRHVSTATPAGRQAAAGGLAPRWHGDRG